MTDQKNFLSKIINAHAEDIISESKVQYFTQCPKCKENYIKDEGHVCIYDNGTTKKEISKWQFLKRNTQKKT